MQTIVISAKDKTEFDLIYRLLKKMNIKAKVLSEEEKEDLGLIQLMKESDRKKTVSRNTIMKKLS